MTIKLEPGLIGIADTIVNETNYAITMGSGDLEVFATPAMVALMEKAACNAINACFDDKTSSVGIKMEITHDAATAPGVKVSATAELIEIVNERKLIFKVIAKDEFKTIGSGMHERFIIDREKFLSKLKK